MTHPRQLIPRLVFAQAPVVRWRHLRLAPSQVPVPLSETGTDLHRSWLPLQHDPSLRQRPMRPLMVSAAISPGHHRQQRHLRHSKTPSTAAPSVPSLCSSPLPYTSTRTRHCCTRRLRKRRLSQYVTDIGTDKRCAMVALIHEVGSRRTKARWAEVVASLWMTPHSQGGLTVLLFLPHGSPLLPPPVLSITRDSESIEHQSLSCGKVTVTNIK